MIARLGLRMRIWLLLIAVSGFVLLSAGWILSVQTLDHGAEQLANLVYATSTAIDEQLYAPQPSQALIAKLQPAGVVLRTAAPPLDKPRAPVGIAVLSKVRALRGAAEAVRFEIGPPTRLWVQSLHQPTRWIGVPVQPLGKPIARASMWILMLTGVVVLIAGAWFTRLLLRPLEQLAQRAPNLMAGDLDLGEFRTAPSEVRALAGTLAQALAQVRSRHEHREQMLVGLSHDLRTPLARLRFAIEMGDHNEAAARASMQADIEEMDALIGAFLLMQREGREEVETAFDLTQLLRELVHGFLARGAIDLSGADLPLRMRGRRLALRRALSNLLQNAFDHGSLPIAIRVSGESTRVLIEVVDSGRRAGRDEGAVGYGIGLGVVRAIAAMHGGGVQMDFAERASCAQLWLPISAFDKG